MFQSLKEKLSKAIFAPEPDQDAELQRMIGRIIYQRHGMQDARIAHELRKGVMAEIYNLAQGHGSRFRACARHLLEHTPAVASTAAPRELVR